MSKFLIKNGDWLTLTLALIFFTDIRNIFLPDFSNFWFNLFADLIIIIIVFAPVLLKIYFQNKNWMLELRFFEFSSKLVPSFTILNAIFIIYTYLFLDGEEINILEFLKNNLFYLAPVLILVFAISYNIVVINEKETVLQINQSIFIPVGSKHRLENKSEQPLNIIEIQTGSYFGEDDITRYEDDFNRV